ncbi:MAG: hypothetical protein AB7P22_09995 [Vicinamibacterales bacterium]
MTARRLNAGKAAVARARQRVYWMPAFKLRASEGAGMRRLPHVRP